MTFKHKIVLLCLLFSCYHLSFAQNISVLSDAPFESNHKVNKIHHSTVIGENVFVLADMRDKSGFIDLLLLKMNKEGNVEQEVTIGIEQTSESPIDIFERADKYYLLMNRITTYSKSLRLYTLSKSLEVIDVEYIDVKNLLEGKAMIYNPKSDVLTISTMVKDRYEQIYPYILEYDISNKSVLTQLELTHINDSTIFEERIEFKKDSVEVPHTIYDENGKYVKTGVKKIATKDIKMDRVQVSKVCNTLSFVDDDLSQLALVGFERTSNVTDFWVAGVQQGRLYWEYIYETEAGGDEAYDIYHSEDELFVLGLDYNKEEFYTKNYGYKILILDKRGKVKSQNIFKRETRSFYKKSVELTGHRFLILGQAENVTYPKNWADDVKINLSNLWLVLTDQNAEKIGEFFHETETRDVASHMTKISDEAFFVFYTSDEELKLLKLKIE